MHVYWIQSTTRIHKINQNNFKTYTYRKPNKSSIKSQLVHCYPHPQGKRTCETKKKKV